MVREKQEQSSHIHQLVSPWGGGMNTRFHFYWFWDGSKSFGGMGERISFRLQKIRLNSLQMRGESRFNLSVFVQHLIFTSLCFPGGGVNTCFHLYCFWDSSKSSEGVSEQTTCRLQKIMLNSLQMREETTINLSVFVQNLIFTSLCFPGGWGEHLLSLGSEWADNFQASENQAKFFADERGISVCILTLLGDIELLIIINYSLCSSYSRFLF